ncbi:MAG: hypothetical protein CMI01_05585 [Oceanospirillaceae bacterium]|nr:hypothetical protein [Oceanospirillaceae bacterium]
MVKRNRRVLWAIWLVALLPLAFAVIAYFTHLPITDQRTNNGVLLDPVLTLEQWGGERQAHVGHWSLIYRGNDTCTEVCQRQMERLRRVHDALGRDAARVRVQQLLTDSALERGVWIVDPNGNLLMRYSYSQIGEPVLDDLKRLLKVSGLG